VVNSAGVVLYFNYLNIQPNDLWEVKIQTFGRICAIDFCRVFPKRKRSWKSKFLCL